MSILLNPSKYEWMTPQKRVQFFNIQQKIFLPGVIASENSARKASNCHVGHCLICVRLKTQKEK